MNVKISQVSGQVKAPYVYGAIVTSLPSGSTYSLDISTFLEKDSVSNTFTRRGLPVSFSAVGKFLAKMMPASNKKSMSIQGPFPLTFIEEDNIASIYCSDSPFVTTQDSYNEMVSDDPCTNPAGQGPGNYDDLCLQEAIKKAGCSAAGTWFQEPSIPAGSMPLSEFKSWLAKQVPKVNTDPEISMGCTGVDISTPCDAFLKNPTSIPDAKCLSFIYSNNSKNSYIGSGYPTSTSKSSPKGPYNFCKADGVANPATANGATLLSGIAKSGYNGKFGIESIKNYLSDMYNKATNTNLNPLIDDAAGGNKTSLLNCLNIVVTPPPPPPIVQPPVASACTVGASRGTFIRHPNGFIGWNPTGSKVINPVGSCITGTCPGKSMSACGNFIQLTPEQFGEYTHCPNYFDCSMMLTSDQCKPNIQYDTNINTAIPLVNGARGDAHFPGISDMQACISAARKRFPSGPLGVTVNPANNTQCWAVPMTSSGPGISKKTGWQSVFLNETTDCCPSLNGTPVYVAGTLGSSVWTAYPQYENGFPKDPGTYWIYGIPNSKATAPIGKGPTVSNTYNNTTGSPMSVTLYCSADDYCEVFINGNRVINNKVGTLISTNYTLQPGCSRIDIFPENTGGPAGIIFAMFNDSTRKPILQSDSSWTITNDARYNLCPPIPGNQVYVSGTVGKSLWQRYGYEDGFPKNPGTYWIYGIAGFERDVPAGKGPTVSNTYNNTTGGPLAVTIYCSFDDSGKVYINGKLSIDQKYTGTPFKYTLGIGCTRFDISPVNNAIGPAGIIFLMVDSNNKTLLQSDSTWVITNDTYINSNSTTSNPVVTPSCTPQMIELCKSLKFRPIGMQVLDKNITNCC
jgi:hypothetical protein